jgi:bacterial/archaeal transporter family-2 protein
MACPPPMPRSSTPICWRSSNSKLLVPQHRPLGQDSRASGVLSHKFGDAWLAGVYRPRNIGDKHTNHFASKEFADPVRTDPQHCGGWILMIQSALPSYTRALGERKVSELARSIGLTLLAILAGTSFVAQQAVNANLRISINSAVWAGFVSYLGGTICMAVLAAILRDPWPAGAVLARSSWWAWSGGLFGAIYIAISILLLPRLGAATTVTLIVVGQMLGSVIFDQYGWMGLPQHVADWRRILGAVLLIAGAVLIRR